MSFPKMRMEEISKSELVLDFLSLGYPQHFQEELEMIKLLAALASGLGLD